MTDSPAFEVMVEAASEGMREWAIDNPACDTQGIMDDEWDEMAEAAVRRAMPATTSRPCETCGGTGDARFQTSTAHNEPCPNCIDGQLLAWAAPQVCVEMGQLEPAGFVNDLGSFGPPTMANARPVFRLRFHEGDAG